MEQTRLVNLPIIGRVQHGEKINNKVKEYGYFIAKTKNDYMQTYIEKFDKLFKGKQTIDIKFFNEEPLTKKYVRYNQSGEVCRCPEGLKIATKKVKNGWQQIQCDTFNCQYRQKNKSGKCACNRIGWLKFLIPSISTDRIFLMKITGQTSINQLDDYIKLQKIQGNSIIGNYTLFLYQKEQPNSLGETFNNYVLDILKKEDSNSSKPIPQIIQNENELFTINTQNVNNQAKKQGLTQTTVKKPDTSITQKQVQNITSEKELKKQDNETETNKNTENINYDNCYVLLKTFTKNILNKGQKKEYFMGEFADMKDQVSEIAIKPDYIEELSECDLGTVVRLDIQDVGNIKFAVKLEFIQKAQKKIAA